MPAWLTSNELDTFSRERMAKYLDMQPIAKALGGRVDYLPESAFPSERFFCMVGTNRGDYEVAKGLSRMFAGHGSDGLVRVENASVWGVKGTRTVTAPAATAYAFRSHSGYFGIVNSEEAYQNLTRFLFGDVRVDIWLEVTDVTLPPALEGKSVEALYEFELLAAPKGKRWYLTRRTSLEDSPACRTHAQLTDPVDKTGRNIYLSTVFLSKRARVDQDDPSLGYAMTVGVKVPDYQVDHAFWPYHHYEGGYLFSDMAIIKTTPPQTDDQDWVVEYGWQKNTAGVASEPVPYKKLKAGKLQISIPFKGTSRPGIQGNIRLVASSWNAE